MQYMFLMYTNENTIPQPGSDAFGAYVGGFGKFTEKAKAGGHLVSGDALQPVATATTVSVRDGKTEIADGPFAQTEEQLGGYYLLDFDNIDDAIAHAAEIPAADYGRVEIRPVVVWN